LYIVLESAETISPLNLRASLMLISVFPTQVGPTMRTTVFGSGDDIFEVDNF